ncbi:uncharacterized protein LOC126576427 isoform X2 [Anopheles aquasalis]|uniref:uncharacterized protein LOC126576427 isoform X2 n=1 Tax=Anopheles aquasalis TaxID=42839 RepID=UPI00215A4A76|nr:uncharacterized protein LOC126576427 isoform X2 [Anopheles aquasalis]
MVEDGSWPAKDNNNSAAVREKEMEQEHGLHQAFTGGGMPQHQQNESPDQHHEEEEMEEEDEEAGGITSEHSLHGEKRKFSEIDSESDEDGFAGFEEDAVSDNLGSPSTTSEALRMALKNQDNRTPENNKSEEEVGVIAPVDDHIEIKQEFVDAAGGAAGGQDATKLAAAAAAKKKANVPVNTQDVIYKLPFKYGWKRELVYRANMDGNSKDKGEVYYITPQGKKLRTRNDIVSALHDDLTMDNFTFVKEPVGGNPDEETIRSAKSYGNPPKRSMDSSADLGKRVPKPKMPKGASPTPPSPYSKAGRLSPKSNASPGVAAGGGGTGVLTVSSRNNVFAGSTKGNSENSNNQERAKSVGKNRKSVDESRKMASNPVSGTNNKHLGTNDRLSGEAVLPAVAGSHVGSSRNHHITASNGSARDPSNFLSEVSAGYQALMQIFDYLKVQELLRASSVCRMWNHVGNHQRFWRTVRMKNSYVKDWGGMIAKLRKNGTKHLDLRKVLNAGSNDEMWRSFIEHIGQAPEIETIDLCRCSSAVVGKLLRSNPNLRVVNALAIKNDPIDFVNFEHGKNLEELRLKSSAPISVDGDLRQLGALRNLKHLSLTSIAKLGATSIDALGSLLLLESLELGECTEIGANLAEILPKLSFLKRLRLEKGQENFDMFTVLDGIAKVATLQQLELINCDVKLGFDKHIVSCRNLTKLLLIPTYVSQSAATNQMILKGILKLHATLQLVVWVITEELLRVTELYIDTNVDDGGVPNKLGETIPILKPVPGSDEPSSVTYQTDVPDKVEIVPLTKLENILERRVPNTKVLILKIPFTNTWKQTMVDHL